MKLYVLGQSGSGKTVLASRLAQAWGIPHLELDIPWKCCGGDRSLFAEEVDRQIRQPEWIADGKHKTVRPLLMKECDHILYLDFPIRTSVRNNLKRARINEEPLPSFMRHLAKVIWQFRGVRKNILSELATYGAKATIVRSPVELSYWVDTILGLGKKDSLR